MKCLQCGSSNLVLDARPVDQLDPGITSDLKIEVYGNPEAWIFKGTTAGSLRANVCVDCGFVMMTVSKEDAQRLAKTKNKQKPT